MLIWLAGLSKAYLQKGYLTYRPLCQKDYLLKDYRTCAIINRGYYFFSLFCDFGFSLMFDGIPLKSRGY